MSFHCLGRSHTMKSPSPLPPHLFTCPPQISHYYLLLIISQKELSPVIELQWAATLIASLDGTMDCLQNEAKNIDLSIMIWLKASFVFYQIDTIMFSSCTSPQLAEAFYPKAASSVVFLTRVTP